MAVDEHPRPRLEKSPASPAADPNAMTWYPPSGLPVYGYTEGAAPPDLQTPWDNLQPPQQASAPPPPAAAPVAPEAAPQAQHAAPHAAPQTSPPPMQQQAMQPPPEAGPHAPSPLGPALTPDERAAQLRGEHPHRHE